MSSRRTGPTSDVQAWIDAANRARGWAAEVKIKRVIFTSPNGMEIPLPIQASPADVARFANRVQNLGLRLPNMPVSPEVVAKTEPSPRPSDIDGLNVEQQAMRVWDRARTKAMAHAVAEEMHDGVLYYVWTAHGLEQFIREVFPSLTEYEPVRGSWGQRPIYDYLRAKGITFEQGQRADHKPGEHHVLIADVWNVEIVREVSRNTARQVRAEAERIAAREVPKVIQGVGARAQQPEPAAPEQAADVDAERNDLLAAWEMFQPTMQAAVDKLLAGNRDGDCDYYRADAANQRDRADRAEALIRAIRDALETMPMFQAFARIVELVPPVRR